MVSRLRYLLARSRHAWHVGLDGPGWERALIRTLYTLGVLRSPSFCTQHPSRKSPMP